LRTGKGDLLKALFFEEGLEDLGGGDGIETLFFLSPGKIGGGELFLGTESA
jgi:hypothetical protein